MKMDLKKDIHFRRNKNKMQIPTKRSLNFVDHSMKKSRWQIVAPITICCIVFLIVFNYFFVVKPIQKLNAIQSDVDVLQSQLTLTYKKLSQYDTLDKQYAHYSYQGYYEAELYLPNREDVVNLVYSIISPKANIGKWTIEDNILSVSLVQSNVKTIDVIASQLESQDFVSYCDIQVAQKAQETVDAQLTIYLLYGGE